MTCIFEIKSYDVPKQIAYSLVCGVRLKKSKNGRRDQKWFPLVQRVFSSIDKVCKDGPLAPR